MMKSNIYILVLLLCTFFSAHAYAELNTDLAAELIITQEEFLSSISPRPSGEDLKNSKFYPELHRRIALIIDNWSSYKNGVKDASEFGQKSIKLILLTSPSEVEARYLAQLKSMGVTFEVSGKKITQADVFYVYGYNNCMGEKILRRINLDVLREMATLAGNNNDNVIVYSYFAAPNRFLNIEKFSAGYWMSTKMKP